MIFVPLRKQTFARAAYLKYPEESLTNTCDIPEDISEELWERFNEKESISFATWPKYNEAELKEESSTIAIMINGKLRGTVNVKNDISKDELIALARKQIFVTKHIKGKIIKEIYVPKKVLNIVCKL